MGAILVKRRAILSTTIALARNRARNRLCKKKKSIPAKERLAQLIEKMTPDEQAAVLEVVRLMIRNRSKEHSIMELEGLGKEIWQGIDAQEYVDELRGPRCG